ncbi:DsbA family oxidoreductase [Rhodopila sp.]|uniref:DsbA family oxidoreductase n=1 Tax=Rhodopila sp. TaxID=2480087 RepID=UPI003D0DAFD6
MANDGPFNALLGGEAETDSRRADAAAIGARIDIVSDAICPWCYVGKRQLERALAKLAPEGLKFQVHWNPFQLNPDMPKEGRDRLAYRAWKFGSAEKAAALDHRITEAAASVGLGFRTDLMTRTPNTIDAHRLIWFAEQNGDQDAAMEAVFRAYFIEGRDIGEQGVLVDCAEQAGLPRPGVVTFLAGDVAEAEMRAADRAAREAGVSGVPSFFLDGYGLFSGAMDSDKIADAFRHGRGILRNRQDSTM